jgi:vacuolar-type H+-ATPase subunit I/STV1
MDVDENEGIVKKPLLNRTPPRKTDQTSPSTSSINNDKSVNKRGLQKTSMDDLFNLIEEKSEKQIAKLDEITINLRSELLTLKDEINVNLDKSLQNIDKKIDKVEMKADQGLKMAMENRKLCINIMKQTRLDCCMDISGLNFTEANNDLKKLALNTIRSFKIKIDDVDIKKVTSIEIKKPNANSTNILTVTFEDVETKMRVMREKNKIKETKGIFFNITLTPENGYYWRKAKFITKGTNLKPKFFDSAVHVQINEGSTMIIQNEENLKELQKLIDELPANLHTANPQLTNVQDQ